MRLVNVCMLELTTAEADKLQREGFEIEPVVTVEFGVEGDRAEVVMKRVLVNPKDQRHIPFFITPQAGRRLLKIAKGLLGKGSR